jgi:hypothetical protein
MGSVRERLEAVARVFEAQPLSISWEDWPCWCSGVSRVVLEEWEAAWEEAERTGRVIVFR